MGGRKSQIYEKTPEELQKLLNESNSYSDILRKLGMSAHGNNLKTLYKIINEYNLDISIISNNKTNYYRNLIKNIPKKISLSDILNNKVVYKSHNLLDRLVKAGLKELRCEKCGITEWNNDIIKFHLHHKDGDHNNNRLENLEVLCPNCHSQTGNFAGKNIKNRPYNIIKDDNNQTIKIGISEDGQKLYNGYKDYKILCPYCKTNYIDLDEEKCQECCKKESKQKDKSNTNDKKVISHKPSKEKLIELGKEYNYNCTKIAQIIGCSRETVSRWFKSYSIECKYKPVFIPPVERDRLKELIRTTSFEKIGKMFGCSAKNITKWCKRLSLPYKKSDINNYSDEEWDKI